MTDDKIREAFEAWFSDSRRNRGVAKRPNFERMEDGTYFDDHTQRHWWTWQNAARAAVPAWQPIETAPTDGTIFLAYRRGVVAMARRIPRDDCEMWHFGTENAAEEYWPGTRPSHWTPMLADPEAP